MVCGCGEEVVTSVELGRLGLGRWWVVGDGNGGLFNQ